MEQIRDHPIVATISIAVGAVLASEVMWKAVLYFRDKREKARRVHEVVCFNELGEICAAQHLRNCSPGSPEPVGRTHLERISFCHGWLASANF